MSRTPDISTSHNSPIIDMILYYILSIIHILKYPKYCSRYIDDLIIPNASDEICEIIMNDVYPEEFRMHYYNDKLSSSFLDLDIMVKQEGFIIKLYDKE